MKTCILIKLCRYAEYFDHKFRALNRSLIIGIARVCSAAALQATTLCWDR